ncbi:MAG: sigma-70 family RNA polymerase sigma factor [Planctomycetota bacterium]
MTISDIETWLDHHPHYLRSVAARCTRDRSLADDLVQETLLYALRKPPRDTKSPRRWLSRVLRSFAITWANADRSRRDRELYAWEPQESPKVRDGRQREEQLRLVRRAVGEMREPYRSTIEQRYFEGLGPQDIARRQGESVHTIKTRLRRARALLRTSLERTHGGEGRSRTLPACLVALLRRAGEGRAGVRRYGALWASAALGVMALPLLLLGASGGRTGEPAPPTSAPATGLDVAALATPAPSAEGHRAVDRLPLDVALSEASAAPVPAIPCLALDADGRPVPGVSLAFRPDGDVARSPEAVTDAEGRAWFGGALEPGTIEATGSWATLYEARLHGFAPQRAVTVVVAPARDVAGSVTDLAGNPLKGVQIGLPTRKTDRDVRSQLHSAIRSGTLWERTNAAGRFALGHVPEIPDMEFLALAPGFREQRFELGAGSHEDLVIRLAPSGGRSNASGEEALLRIQGRVVDASWTPLREAQVSAGKRLVSTDAEGRFELSLDLRRGRLANLLHDLGDDFPAVVAIAAGHQPALAYGVRPGGEVVLRLGPPPRALQGRVVDRAGSPLAGVRVAPHEVFQVANTDLERSLGGDPKRGRSPQNPYEVVTDERGEFLLPGLFDRPYRLLLRDPASGARRLTDEVVVDGVPLELSLGPPEVWRTVAGRVTDPSGVPLAAGLVTVVADIQHLRHGRARFGTRTEVLTSTVLKADGTFLLEDVPKEGAYLSVLAHRAAFFGREGGLGEPLATSLTGLELTVPRNARLELELPAGAADRFQVFDADGRLVFVLEDAHEPTPPLRRVKSHPIPTAAAGAAEPLELVLPEDAALLVLYERCRTVARLELDLRPGEVQRLAVDRSLLVPDEPPPPATSTH